MSARSSFYTTFSGVIDVEQIIQVYLNVVERASLKYVHSHPTPETSCMSRITCSTTSFLRMRMKALVQSSKHTVNTMYLEGNRLEEGDEAKTSAEPRRPFKMSLTCSFFPNKAKQPHRLLFSCEVSRHLPRWCGWCRRLIVLGRVINKRNTFRDTDVYGLIWLPFRLRYWEIGARD